MYDLCRYRLGDAVSHREVLRNYSKKAYLETVRCTLAGGARSKDEARSAWGQFVEHAGNNVWELIALAGGLVAG